STSGVHSTAPPPTPESRRRSPGATAPGASPSTITGICHRPTSPTGEPAGTASFSGDRDRRTAQSDSLIQQPLPHRPVFHRPHVSLVAASPVPMGVRDGLGPTAHTELAVEHGQTVDRKSVV